MTAPGRAREEPSLSEVLTPIWQRVLRRSPIGLEENFFDLGGDSSSALKLFTEIAQTCGRQLSPLAIFQAPTIAGLAALLQRTNMPTFLPLIQLKAGTSKPAVFITHGRGGSVLEFSHLLRHIQTDHPIYGLQAKGIDGLGEPFDRIEDLAQYFLDAIREMQPRGPYVLIGYSLGGLVVLEMAQRLSEIGERIALLAMLESYPARRFLSMIQRIRLYSHLLRKHASNAMQLPLREAISYILRPSERIEHIAQDHAATPSERRPIRFSLTPVMQHVRDAGRQALDHYRPRFYPGKMHFVKAEISSDFPDNPTAVWGDLAAEFVVETVPGDHRGIITTHSERLGSVLSRYLRGAFDQK